MATKTNQKKSNHKKSNLSTTGAVASVAPIPEVGAPSPPTGFVAAPRGRGRGKQPLLTELNAAPTAAAELRASGTTYVDEFGKKAPPSQEVADALELAATWTGQVRDAVAWTEYAKACAAHAWNVAAEYVNALKPAFAYASKRDTGVVKRFPQVAQLVEAASLTGKRGANTRALARKKAAKSKAPAPSASTSSSAKPATAAETPTAPVNGGGAVVH